MEQYIAKPFKRFMYASKEFVKKRKNFDSVHYTANCDTATINMSEIKSIIKPSTTDDTSLRSTSKNNVLFNDSIQTYISNPDTDNNNTTEIVKVKILEAPVKELPTILNLNSNLESSESLRDQERIDFDGLIHENVPKQPPIIKIKIRVVNKTDDNNSSVDFENSTGKLKIGDSCIFDENKSRPLSPIPILPPKNNELSNIDNLINFHEVQSRKVTNRTPPKTLPRMGTSSLLNRSKSKLNDSEIISELVRDRFIVNMYESRSYRRSFIKKPSTFGRIYKSLERSINLKNDFITKEQLLNNDTVQIKQSSPLKLQNNQKIEEIIKNMSENFKNYSISEELPFEERQKSCVTLCKEEILQNTPKIEENIPQILEDFKRSSISEELTLEVPQNSCETQYGENNVQNTSKIEESIPQILEDFKRSSISEELTFEGPQSFCETQYTENFLQNTPKIEESVPPIMEDFKNSSISTELPLEVRQNSCEALCKEEILQNNKKIEENIPQIDFKSSSISEKLTLEGPQNSCETLYKEDMFLRAQSSEYGSGSNIQDSTISLEKHLDEIPEIQDEHTFGSDGSSYNMEEFLKKALGDELDELDSTEIVSKETLPMFNPPAAEESICTSNASDLISKINTFQSNLYRSFTKKLQLMTGTLRLSQEARGRPQDDQSLKSDLDSLFSNNEELTSLLRQAAVQYESLKQISKALNLCRSSKEFCVSSEQIEAERLLLIATYKRQATLDEIRRLEYSSTPTEPTSEVGTLTISHTTLPLKPSTPEEPRGRDLSKWYLGIFSSGLQVVATQSTPAAGDGSVKFAEEVVFKNLPTGFIVNLEVYCLLQRKSGRNFSHESKYHINKETKRSHCPTPKKFLVRDKCPQKIPTRYDTGIRTSSFKLCGSLKLTVGDLPKAGPWELRGKIPLCSSLTGIVDLDLNSSVLIPVQHSGFLTIGAELGGYASWNRRWCVLDGCLIRYWSYPSEEETKEALKVLDLQFCLSSKIQIADRSICARPRTLLMEIGDEKYYLSADNIRELNIWQEKLNKVVKALRIWNV